MGSVARILAAGCAAAALAGCALVAGYDFGKYGEDHDGGLGGGATSASSGQSSSAASSSHAAASTGPGATTGSGGGSPAGCVDGGAVVFGAEMLLLTTTMNPVSITNDAKNVYWTADGATPGSKTGSVSRTDKSGSPSVVLASGQTVPRAIQVDDTNVYWFGHQLTTSSEIWQVDKTSNGTVQPFSIWSVAPGIVNDIFLFDKVIYFTYDAMGVYQLDLVAKSYQRLVQNAPLTTPKAVTADATSLYYVEEPVPLVPKTTSIMAWNRTTQVGTTLATLEDGVQGIAAAGAEVYWSTTTGIRHVPKAGGLPQTLVAFPGPCAGLAVNGGYAYCTLTATKAVLAYELAAPNAAATIHTMGSLQGVTAACEAVYFVDGTSIMKASR